MDERDGGKLHTCQLDLRARTQYWGSSCHVVIIVFPNWVVILCQFCFLLFTLGHDSRLTWSRRDLQGGTFNDQI